MATDAGSPAAAVGPPTDAKRGCSLRTLSVVGVAFLALLALLAWVLIERSDEDDPANVEDPGVIAGDAPEGVVEGDECLLANVLEISAGPVAEQPGNGTSIYDVTVTITSTAQVPIRVLEFRSFSTGGPESLSSREAGTLSPGASTTVEMTEQVFDDGTETYDITTHAVAYLDSVECSAEWSGVDDISAFGTAVVAVPNPLPLAS